jgi:hypothetical protein
LHGFFDRSDSALVFDAARHHVAGDASGKAEGGLVTIDQLQRLLIEQ